MTEKNLTEQQPQPIELTERGQVVLPTVPDVYNLCGMVVRSGLAPRGLDTQEKLCIASLAGLSMGFNFWQSIQNLYVINGRPAVFGKGALALARRNPQWGGMRELWVSDRESSEVAPIFPSFNEIPDDLTATCELTRVGEHGKELTLRQFSVQDAKLSGLWLKPNSAWVKYPLRMLTWRARSWALYDVYSDSLLGLPIVEDLQAEGSDLQAPVAATVSIKPAPEFERIEITPELIEAPAGEKNDLFAGEKNHG